MARDVISLGNFYPKKCNPIPLGYPFGVLKGRKFERVTKFLRLYVFRCRCLLSISSCRYLYSSPPQLPLHSIISHPLSLLLFITPYSSHLAHLLLLFLITLPLFYSFSPPVSLTLSHPLSLLLFLTPVSLSLSYPLSISHTLPRLCFQPSLTLIHSLPLTPHLNGLLRS